MKPSRFATEFAADLSAWNLPSTEPGKWFRPECACIEHVRERIADGSVAGFQVAWDEFRARDHVAIARKTILPSDIDLTRFPSLNEKQAWLDQTRGRCAATMRGLIATIDAALDIVRTRWYPGIALSSSIRERLVAATTAYAEAWGLRPDGAALPAAAGFATNLPRALQAMKEAVKADECSAPAWLAVHRLLDYLLSGELASSRQQESRSDASLAPPSSVRTRSARPGSPDNPVLVRVLFAAANRGEMHDVKVVNQVDGPASWYVDPVQLGLTVLQPDFIESLQLAWHAGLADMPHASAVRVAPQIVDRKVIDGPSAGAVIACGMVAAMRGDEPLDLDASASVALRLGEGRSLNDGQPIRLTDIWLDDVGGVKEKLGVARRERLQEVVLTERQADAALRAKWNKAGMTTVTVVPAKTLDDVYRHLTSNAQMERVLVRYSQQVLDDWQQVWTDPDSERGSLLYYIPPAYRLFDPEMGKRDVEMFVQLHDAATGQDGDQQLKHVDLDLPDEEDTLVELLRQGGDRLCISEGPGAGKTTFTRRLRAFLSSQRAREEFADGGAILAVRWEESADSRDAAWPVDFVAAIAELLDFASSGEPDSPPSREVVEYALRRGRVVLILDALDQTAPERVTRFHEFLKLLRSRNDWRVRVVLTGRTYAVDAIKRQLASIGDWRFGAILPFDRRRQYLYLRGPFRDSREHDPWSNRPIDFAKLGVSSDGRPRGQLVAALPPDADDDARLGELTSLFPYYGEIETLLGNPNTLFMARRLTEQGRVSQFLTRAELYCQTSGYMLREAARKYRSWPTDANSVTEFEREVQLSDIRRWESILAAAAFTMMADNPGHYRVSGQVAIAELSREASVKVVPAPSEADWKLIERIARLTNQSLLYHSSEKLWAWPDRRMMEFYCGLHLACNGEPGWVKDPGEGNGPPRCGNGTVRTHAADPEWEEAFKFALEIPTGRRDDERLLASIAELYEPVTQPQLAKGKLPWLRPTELMYRAWCLLEELPMHERAQASPKLLAGGERVLAAYRDQLSRLLKGDRRESEIAGQILDEFVEVPEACSVVLALTDPQPIDLDAFLLGRTAVTREQYGLFDASFLRVDDKESKFKIHRKRSLREPAKGISWYDAWCMARWVGGRLPTEAEWEYACVTGSRAKLCMKRVHGENWAWDQLVEQSIQGEFGYALKRSPGEFGLLPSQKSHFDEYEYEWCESWCEEGDWYANLPGELARNPGGPIQGLWRSCRGGCYRLIDGMFIRDAFRYRFKPNCRSGSQIFRLVRGWSPAPG